MMRSHPGVPFICGIDISCRAELYWSALLVRNPQDEVLKDNRRVKAPDFRACGKMGLKRTDLYQDSSLLVPSGLQTASIKAKSDVFLAPQACAQRSAKKRMNLTFPASSLVRGAGFLEREKRDFHTTLGFSPGQQNCRFHCSNHL